MSGSGTIDTQPVDSYAPWWCTSIRTRIDVALVTTEISAIILYRDYLAQRGMEPLFFTDTEVAALGFDLHHRVYGYPMEYLIESLAPTSELDFVMLLKRNKRCMRPFRKHTFTAHRWPLVLHYRTRCRQRTPPLDWNHDYQHVATSSVRISARRSRHCILCQ